MNDSIMTCSTCGTEADVAQDSHAWDGWKVTDGAPHCPDCQKREELEQTLDRS